MSKLKPNQVIIPIGELSKQTQTIPLIDDTPMPHLSVRLKTQSVKDSLGEYLVKLLLAGFVVSMETVDGDNTIVALSQDFIQQAQVKRDATR